MTLSFDAIAQLNRREGVVELLPPPKKRALSTSLATAIAYYPWHRGSKGHKVARVESALPMLFAMKGKGFVIGLDDGIREYLTYCQNRAKTRIERCQVPLFDYQKEGIERMSVGRRFMLCDEMGLGKTLQAIACIEPHHGTTVVCPAVVKGHWAAEIRRARPDLTVEVVEGMMDEWSWPAVGTVRICNPQILPPTARESASESEKLMAERGLIDLSLVTPSSLQSVVIDEAHFAKKERNILARRLQEITTASYASGGNLTAVTATPVTNKPKDLWGVLRVCLLAGDTFGTYSKFCHAFQCKRTGPKGMGLQWGKPLPYVSEILSLTMIRRKKAEVLSHLPPKIYQTLYVPPPADLVAPDEGQDKMPTETEGIVFDQLAAYRASSARAKIPYMLEIVEQFEAADQPLVVFSYHKEPILELESRDGWAIITGATPARARSMLVDRFQKGHLKGLGLTISAGGVGITLTAASDVLFVDRSWSPSDNEQATDRLHRIGQQSTVRVMDLCFDHPLDRRVLEVCQDKEESQEMMGLGFSTKKGAE